MTFATLNDEQFRRFDQLSAALEAHGYAVNASPIPGMETLFLDDLAAALAKVEETAAFLRKRYGYRGLSRCLVDGLTASLPHPSLNVDVA